MASEGSEPDIELTVIETGNRPTLMKVTRFEDGTVGEVSLDPVCGFISETYHHSFPSAILEEPVYATTVEPFSESTTQKAKKRDHCWSLPQGQDTVEADQNKASQRKADIVLLFLAAALAVVFAVIFSLGCNPYLTVPEETDAASYRLTKPAFLKEVVTSPYIIRKGCNREDFCERYRIPILVPPMGSFYPDFTRGGDGLNVDFLSAAITALGIMANQSCSFHLMMQDKTLEDGRLSEALGYTVEDMLQDIFRLEHGCLPEIDFVFDNPAYAEHFYGVRGADFLRRPEPLPCDTPWFALFNATISPKDVLTSCMPTYQLGYPNSEAETVARIVFIKNS